MTRPRIELMIDELILHGYSQRESRDIAAAAEAELHRLLGEPGAQNVPSSGIGAEVGRAIYGALNGRTR